MTSLKQLGEAIKNHPEYYESTDPLTKKDKQFQWYSAKGTKEYIEKIEVLFDTFKKDCVCIPRKQLQKKLEFNQKQFDKAKGFFCTPYGAKIQLLRELLRLGDEK